MSEICTSRTHTDPLTLRNCAFEDPTTTTTFFATISNAFIMAGPDYRYLQAWARPSASSGPSASRQTYDRSNSYEVILPTSDGDTATQAAQPPTATKGKGKDEPEQSSYQVRLDTPGGISYAPDALAQHNSVKRLFIPASMHDRNAQHYNFAKEIETRYQAKQGRLKRKQSRIWMSKGAPKLRHTRRASSNRNQPLPLLLQTRTP